MAAIVTEEWSEESYQRGKSATRVFKVSGVSDTDEAATALGVPQENDTHPRDNRLLAQVPEARGGQSIYVVTVRYERRDTKGPTDTENPLDEPLKFRWVIGTESVQVDRDKDGNPILNAAGDPFDTPATADKPTLTLIVSQNESTFNLARAMATVGRVCSDTFTIPGVGTVLPGQCRCISISPAEQYFDGYELADGYVRVEYVFEFREDDAGNPGWSFDHRILNQGYRGWWNDGAANQRGDFYTAGDTPDRVSVPVLLASDGTPVASQFKINKELEAPVANPAAPTGATVTGSYIYYRRYERVAFAGLL